jgi:hypothetical protein
MFEDFLIRVGKKEHGAMLLTIDPDIKEPENFICIIRRMLNMRSVSK